MESSINQPHPDAEPDDAAAFFGEEDELSAPVPEEPAAVQQTGTSPTDTRTAEERGEDSYQYKLTRGEPISVEEEQRHAAFVAAQGEQPAAAEVEYEPQQQQEALRAIAEREAAEAAATEGAPPAPEPDAPAPAEAATPAPASEAAPAADPPTAAAAAGGTPGTAAAADGQGDGSGESTGGSEKQSGSLEREYIVFRAVTLTPEYLRAQLAAIEAGNAPDPAVAFVEMERHTTRNDKQAVAKTYTAHAKELGDVCDLAAVSSRSWKVRHVKPREVVTSDVQIV